MGSKGNGEFPLKIDFFSKDFSKMEIKHKHIIIQNV